MVNREVKIEDMAKKALETLKCPVCQSNEFVVNSNITAKFPIDRDNNHCGGNIWPSLEFTCTECGNIISMNADILARKVINDK